VKKCLVAKVSFYSSDHHGPHTHVTMIRGTSHFPMKERTTHQEKSWSCRTRSHIVSTFWRVRERQIKVANERQRSRTLHLRVPDSSEASPTRGGCDVTATAATRTYVVRCRRRSHLLMPARWPGRTRLQPRCCLACSLAKDSPAPPHRVY
jgi:hypothetical protein